MRTKRFTLMLTDAEYSDLSRRAKDSRETVSGFSRRLLFPGPVPELPMPRRERRAPTNLTPEEEEIRR
jgi:hypothetical protein